VECGSLLRNSSWGSSSLGVASSVQRSISISGSLPGASLELLPALPAAGGNVCGAAVSGNSGSWGIGRVCGVVLVALLLVLLLAYAMQQRLAGLCLFGGSNDGSSGSSGDPTAVSSKGFASRAEQPTT
jgi:hypothetical protein